MTASASVPNVIALPGNPGTVFDDGVAWPLPPTIELQYGAQISQSESVSEFTYGGPDDGARA